LIVDAKHIKLYNKWIYFYVAIDEQSGEPLQLQVMPHKGADSAHLFLLQLKALGYYPDTMVTDLCPDYPAIVTKVFPKAYHHQCVFHVPTGSGQKDWWITICQTNSIMLISSSQLPPSLGVVVDYVVALNHSGGVIECLW
jgi:transposase-like protein